MDFMARDGDSLGLKDRFQLCVDANNNDIAGN
jgi:hypothetical protein